MTTLYIKYVAAIYNCYSEDVHGRAISTTGIPHLFLIYL